MEKALLMARFVGDMHFSSSDFGISFFVWRMSFMDTFWDELHKAIALQGKKKEIDWDDIFFHLTEKPYYLVGPWSFVEKYLNKSEIFLLQDPIFP